MTEENDFQLEQAASGRRAAEALPVDLQILFAGNDTITQSAQILRAIRGDPDLQPDAIIFRSSAARSITPVEADAANRIRVDLLAAQNDLMAVTARKVFQAVSDLTEPDRWLERHRDYAAVRRSCRASDDESARQARAVRSGKNLASAAIVPISGRAAPVAGPARPTEDNVSPSEKHSPAELMLQGSLRSNA
jgi:hypothetical protein